MSKDEIRSILRAEGSVAGDSAFEVEQFRRLQEAQAKNRIQGFETITLTCGNVLSLICCS